MSTSFVPIADIVAAVEETRAMGRGLRGLNTWAIDSIVADWHRLRAIEAAAREVLATGQARYDVLRSPTDPEGFLIPDESAWVGDLVPAVAMIALRAAVEGVEAVTDRADSRQTGEA